MAEFFAELKRRQMYRVAAAYAVVAWLLLQLVNNLTPALNLPNWAATLVTVLLIVGFPIALLFCWIQRLEPADAASAMKTGRVDWVLIGGLAAVLLFMAYQQLAPPRQPGLDAVKEAAASQGGAISLAVLPFTNLSSDREQEFFSDGMTEEITAALAKVPDLRVVARTSAFAFKGQNRDIQVIGQQLRATHLIEGSVRKIGDRVRITAQLINASDGTHIWSESYDRNLTDVFAIQEEIARAITVSLRMPLGLKPGENLVSQRTKDAAVHEAYLRAKTLVRGNLPEAIRILNEVVAREPDYAPAWGVLARAYELSIVADSAVQRGAIDEATPFFRDYAAKAAAAAERAYRLDPNNSDAVYGYAQAMGGRLNVARLSLLERSLELDPDNPEPLVSYSLCLAALGFTKEALKVSEHLIAVEPFAPVYRPIRVRLLFSDGQLDEAIKLGTASLSNGTRLALAQAYAAQTRFNEAADVLMPVNGPDAKFQQLLVTAVQMLRDARAPLPLSERPELGVLDWIYVYRGAPERLAQHYKNLAHASMPIGVLNGLQFPPAYSAMRRTPEFKQYIRESGSLEYWRAKGWPEQCHPTTADDFDCN